MDKVLGMILAGGHGKRLSPLTDMRSKPAVPFGSKYRIVDFVLNNFVNSGLYSIYVLTQFRAQSLTDHIQRYWRFGAFLDDHFISLVPAQMSRYEELGAAWYRGTADAVYQNQFLIDRHSPDVIAIFGGDHIFKMNVAHMVDYHREHDADITIAAYPVAKEEATRFGVIQVDDEWRMIDFEEKVANPKTIPGQPNMSLASMGNYLFRREVLDALLEDDAQDLESAHDFGKNVIPRALAAGYKIQVYDFHRNPIPGQSGPNTYWRDVGTLDAYYEANIALTDYVPEFDLFNEHWPLRTANRFSPPAKFVHDKENRTGQAINSLLGGGVIISGSTVRESVLFRNARVNSYAQVDRSILMERVNVGRHCKIKNTIIDGVVNVPPGTTIGYDVKEDRARGFTVTESGVVVVPKAYRFES